MKAKETVIVPAGVHRAKMWQLMFFACNNVATYLYSFLIGYIAYFMGGALGVATVFAGIMLTTMRIWDGITDPIAGWVLDRVETRFGKFRVFMLVGNLMMAVTTFLMFKVSPLLPGAGKMVSFIVFYLIYVLGFTCQGICTRGAQSCLTSDPKQRPTYAAFDGVLYAIAMITMTLATTNVFAKRFPDFGVGFFNAIHPIVAIASFILTVIAIIGIWQWDVVEYHGLNKGSSEKVRVKDYVDVLKNNKAVQMMVLSTASDRLAATVGMNATIGVIFFGIILGSYDFFAVSNLVGGLLAVVVGVIYLQYARKAGNKKALKGITWAGLISSVILIALVILGRLTNESGVGALVMPCILVKIVLTVVQALSSTMTNPMTGDCIDYEVYRSGKYCPGLIATLYSLIDKLANSIVTVLVALMCAAIGFTQNLPTLETAYSDSLLVIGLISMAVLPLLGFLLNVYALKHYPLDKETVEMVTAKIAEIKEQKKNEQ